MTRHCITWARYGLPVAALWLVPGWASAAVLQVGTDKPYQTVSEAISAASPGDVIEVDSGEYVDDFSVISTGDLTIRGVGNGRPHLRATQNIPNKKGIFVVQIDTGPIVVENLEFSGAQISEADGSNGAGIRMQGSALVVRDCYFHDNQNGILAGGTEGFTVTIEGSEFGENGNAGSGYEHNVYISGEAAELVFRGNYSHHARSGHTLKSRAHVNYVLYNRLMDEADGTSSYLIDLPEGGRSYIIGNLVQQGPMAENTGTVINYKGEGDTNPDLALYVVHNTIVNESMATPDFVRIHAADEAIVRNNLFVGQGTAIGLVDPNIVVTDEGNIQTDMPGLVDQAGYDYHLLESSEAVDAGVDPGMGAGFGLTPNEHYVHPIGLEPRPMLGTAPDVGAYEWGDEPPGGADTGGADGGSSGGADSAGDEGSDGTGAVDDGSGTETGASRGGTGSSGGSADGDQEGCGCRQSLPRGPSSLALLAVVALCRRRGGGLRGRAGPRA